MGIKIGIRKTSFFTAAALFLALTASAIAGESVSAKDAAEHMDKSKYSSSEIKTYLKGLKGQTITANGKIHDILSGKTGNRVVLSVNAGRTKDFVVDVYVDDASKLHKGEQVSCKGEYAKYNMFTVNGITLKNGSCSNR